MKLLKTILFFTLIVSVVFSNPVKVETEAEDIQLASDKSKRFNIGTYFSSIGNFFVTKDIKRNVKYNQSRDLDIYYKKNDKNLKPVVIFIYGGTWYLGDKTFYSKLGDFLNDNGYVTVIPNYAQIPWGFVNDMIYDISSAISWIYNNIYQYGGDNQKIILLGHSSGAHLSILTLIQSSLGYTWPRLPNIYKTVLFNGPYDFDCFSDIAKKTGVVPTNSDFEKFVKTILGSENSCPTDILRRYPNKSIQSLGANKVNVIITGDDTVVPESSAQGLLQEIRRTSDVPFSYYIMPQVQHCGLTEGIMNGDTGVQGFVLYVLTN